MRRGAKVFVSWGSAVALILIMSSVPLISQTSAKGDLVGFVSKKDGSTPVAGAVVVVKNLTSGLVIEGNQSDAKGAFRFEGLEPGLYALGVKSAQGSYNSQDFFGVTAGKTSKISIALDPYDTASAAAAAAVIKEQRDKGEAFIGRVTRYLPASKEAEVQIEIGLIQDEDRIHIKGQVTDFYQDMRVLKAYGARTKRVLSGYTALFKTSKPCEPGDFVYIVCKRGVPPFFLAPLGIAAIVAGDLTIKAIYSEDISQYKIKQY
jgi:Carboxypeptidase regulatory-like domain